MTIEKQENQTSKEDILALLRQRKEEFTPEEILEVLEKDSPQTTTEENGKPGKQAGNFSRGRSTRQKTFSAITYSLGVLVVMVGVALLIGQFWQDLESGVRIMVTFGLGLAVYFSVVILEGVNKSPHTLRTALAMLSFLLTVSGTGVLLIELFESLPGSTINLTMSLLLTLMAGALCVIRRSGTYLLFLVAFATWVLYSFISLESLYRISNSLMEQPDSLYAYLSILIGFIYFLLGQYWREEHTRLSKVLFILGTAGLSIPFLILSEIYQTLSWNLVGLIVLATLSRVSFRLGLPSVTVTTGLILTSYITSGTRLGPNTIFNIFGIPLSFLLLILIITGTIKKHSYWPHLLVIILSITWFFYTVLFLNSVQVLLNTHMRYPEAITMILTSLISIGYIIISYRISRNIDRYPKFTSLLYFMGGLGLVTPLMFLAEYYSNFWDIIALIALGIFIAFGGWINKKSVIVTGGLLLAGYIFVISFRYFAENLGWPFALIIAGFLLIGAGYLYYRLASRAENSIEPAKDQIRQ